MKTKERNYSKNGISLIVLVITIIVIIILALAVILSIANNNPIDNAKKATDEYNKAQEKEKITLDVFAIAMDIRENKDKIPVTNQQIKDASEIQKYIPSYDPNEYTLWISYGNVVCIQSENMSKEKIEACESHGIYLLGDVNNDGVVDDYDKDYFDNYIVNNVNKLNDREKIVGDVDGSGKINMAESSSLVSLFIVKTVNVAIDKMKAEFDVAMEKEGENRVNITTFEYEEVKKYIPSYVDSRYNFGIARGNLVIYSNQGLASHRLSICDRRGIYLIGDIEKDGHIYPDDLDTLNEYIAGNYAPTSKELERFLIVADVNYDGIVNSSDANILTTMLEEEW